MLATLLRKLGFPGALALSVLLVIGCSGLFGGSETEDGTGSGTGSGTVGPDAGAGGTSTSEDGGTDASTTPPSQYTPCEEGDCWSAPPLMVVCDQLDVDEDFSSGNYNVHEYALAAPADVPIELTLSNTAGEWSPALLLRTEDGEMIHDGELSLSDAAIEVELIASGQNGDAAAVRITAHQDALLFVFVTSWTVVDSSFLQPMPTNATYQLSVLGDCEAPPPGELLSPPNFDPNDIVDGFYLLPEAPGLYTRKADDCSRGTKLLIDVLYTVAWHWQTLQPTLSPINILDLNEGSCSTVDHATHDDGTHADLTAGCATEVACADNEPAIQLAKLFVDTGETCGIINNDTAVQAEVNAYFESKYAYEPWHSTFMRSVSGHTHHFHIRVKKPDGTCN